MSLPRTSTSDHHELAPPVQRAGWLTRNPAVIRASHTVNRRSMHPNIGRKIEDGNFLAKVTKSDSFILTPNRDYGAMMQGLIGRLTSVTCVGPPSLDTSGSCGQSVQQHKQFSFVASIIPGGLKSTCCIAAASLHPTLLSDRHSANSCGST